MVIQSDEEDGPILKLYRLSHLPTSSLTPGFFSTVNLSNDYFPLPDSVPDTVMAGLDVRNVFIV